MKKNIAIVTGGSSGLGKEFVKLLLKERNVDEIWLIARNHRKLNAVKNQFGKKVMIFSADLSQLEEVKKFKNVISHEDVSIKFLINNAGFGKFGSFNDAGLDEYINMIHLNICAVVTMCDICIPYMKRGSHIINISSQTSFHPLPYFNIYSSTKVFIRHYSRALNIELKYKEIFVTTVCPPWMNTNYIGRAKTNGIKSPNNFVGIVTPDKVARKALRDAKSNKTLSNYGPHSKLSHISGKLLPQGLIMKLWLKQQGL